MAIARDLRGVAPKTHHSRQHRGPPHECVACHDTALHDTLIAFNRHVLALATDTATPSLERVRFLAILGRNLDEFYAVHVGEAMTRLSHPATHDPDALPLASNAAEHVMAAAKGAAALARAANTVLWQRVQPSLARHGLRLRRWSQLGSDAQSASADWVAEHVVSQIRPPVYDARTALPHVPAFALALVIRERGDAGRLLVVPLPERLPGWIDLRGTNDLVATEELVRVQWAAIARSTATAGDAFIIRVTRAIDARADAETASDSRAVTRAILARRPFAPVVRIEVGDEMPKALRTMLRALFRAESSVTTSLGEAHVVATPSAPTALASLDDVADLPEPHLHYPALLRAPGPPAATSLFADLRRQDRLVHFPFDAFADTIGRFLADAAADPHVTHIYTTLYRTDSHAEVVDTLIGARQAGKEVIVLVELMARLDEAQNLRLAERLAVAGCTVAHAPTGLKVHGKVGLVLRRTGGAVERYAYVSSGNLNPSTARHYTDFALMSTRAELASEVERLFGELMAHHVRGGYEHLLVSPLDFRKQLLALIAEEASYGARGLVRAKVNGLDDAELIAALYGASCAGTQIELIVRGLCTLRPGIPGQSENIRVVSVLGRFLEHGRIYAFGRGLAARYWIGSADWRLRNLSRRIEVAAPIPDRVAAARLEHILTTQLADPLAWRLRADGSYVRHKRNGGEREHATQKALASRVHAQLAKHAADSSGR
jgi:polyphosphate kinase